MKNTVISIGNGNISKNYSYQYCIGNIAKTKVKSVQLGKTLYCCLSFLFPTPRNRIKWCVRGMVSRGRGEGAPRFIIPYISYIILLLSLEYFKNCMVAGGG